MMIDSNLTCQIHLNEAAEQTLLISVQLMQPFELTTYDKLHKLLKSFVDASAVGAFPRENVHPVESNMTLLDEKEIASIQVQWKCRAYNIDYRSFRVLRNSLVAFSQIAHPVKTLSVHEISDAIAPNLNIAPLTAGKEHEFYPSQSSLLPFEVIFERPVSYRKGRRALIEFVEPIKNEIIDKTIDYIDYWAEIALGGFSVLEGDLLSGHCAIYDIDSNQFDDYTLESKVYYFGGSETAWNPFINIMGTVDRNLSRIRTVTIN